MSYLITTIVSILSLLLSVACTGDSPQADETAIRIPSQTAPEPATDEGSQTDDDATVAAEPGSSTIEPLFPPLEPLRDAEVILQAVSWVGPNGATLSAGNMSAELPGFRPAIEVGLSTIGNTQILSPMPLSTVLAAAELTPLYTPLDELLTLKLPLLFQVPEDTTLQLLLFNPGMDAFVVADEKRPSADGTVTFHTNYLSQYLVIAKPVRSGNPDCRDNSFAIDEREPDIEEAALIGRVAENERIDRDTAFRVLSDLRYFPGNRAIVFKDEEQRRSYDDGRPRYDGEDYLVDPRMAPAVINLGQRVLSEWIDPISGSPAIQLRITEAFDSLIEHSRRSNHYRGRAVDLTLSPVPAPTTRVRREMYGRLSRLAVCSGFDFVHFENRFHVHASSHPARIAFIEDQLGSSSVITAEIDGLNRQNAYSTPLDIPNHSAPKALVFNEEGNVLDIYFRRYGQPQVLNYDLDSETENVLSPVSAIPEVPRQVSIDPSLILTSDGGPLQLMRPDRPESLQTYEADLTDPFPITGTDSRTRAPASWIQTRPVSYAVGALEASE